MSEFLLKFDSEVIFENLKKELLHFSSNQEKLKQSLIDHILDNFEVENEVEDDTDEM